MSLDWNKIKDNWNVRATCPQCQTTHVIQKGFEDPWKISYCGMCGTAFTRIEIQKSNYWYYPIEMSIEEFNKAEFVEHIIWHPMEEGQKYMDKEKEMIV